VVVECHDFTFYLLSEMTDTETLDNTGEEKKNHWAAMREKYDGQISDLQAKLDAEIAGRAADKKLYFGNTMKSRGYDWDFNSFADKYSNLSIDDMVSLYEGQHWKVQSQQVQPATQPEERQATNEWPKSVIAWANPTTEVGWPKLNEMKSEDLIKRAKTQPRMHM